MPCYSTLPRKPITTIQPLPSRDPLDEDKPDPGDRPHHPPRERREGNDRLIDAGCGLFTHAP